MKKLKLNEDYRHFDSLIWQIPSWGIAIAVGVVVASHEIGSNSQRFNIPINYVQAIILGFGFVLLLALTIALYKYRIFQAATLDGDLPSPPFNKKPSASKYLQCSMCITSGGIAGLTAAQTFFVNWLILVGIILGILGWIIIEINKNKIVNDLNDKNQNVMNDNNQTTHFITWKHKSTDFSAPLSLDDKIEIFYEQVYGWQLNIADKLVNGDDSISHADFACLQIVLSYFEMISKYNDGDTSTGGSKRHFKKGVMRVYPNIFSGQPNIDDLLNRLYIGARCGLYHMGMTKPKLIVYSGSPSIAYDDLKDIIAINTHTLTVELKTDLASYKDDLNDSSNTTLRSNFEAVFDNDH